MLSEQFIQSCAAIHGEKISVDRRNGLDEKKACTGILFSATLSLGGAGNSGHECEPNCAQIIRRHMRFGNCFSDADSHVTNADTDGVALYVVLSCHECAVR